MKEGFVLDQLLEMPMAPFAHRFRRTYSCVLCLNLNFLFQHFPEKKCFG